jgi:hypothetical protein
MLVDPDVRRVEEDVFEIGIIRLGHGPHRRKNPLRDCVLRQRGQQTDPTDLLWVVCTLRFNFGDTSPAEKSRCADVYF